MINPGPRDYGKHFVKLRTKGRESEREIVRENEEEGKEIKERKDKKRLKERYGRDKVRERERLKPGAAVDSMTYLSP